jgi:HTH-type transcriptional regulator, transcriptional repressor of NAD biosynthesis genes
MLELPPRAFSLGLVVGKFSPLHKGHELVIRRAFEACRKVVLISYSNPEFPGCEARRREQWLTHLFPEVRSLVVDHQRLAEWSAQYSEPLLIPPNDAPDSIQRRFTAALCLRVLGIAPDAVFTSEGYGEAFAKELTAYFREVDPRAAEVRHTLVDRDRNQVPISGTAIRSDIHLHRHWLSPVVYASFLKRVCILGGESSGKSTLAMALAQHFATVQVPEYGRELWDLRNGVLTFEDMLHIGEAQVAAEERSSLKAFKFLFCDTSPLTTLFYSQHLFHRADPKLERLAERPYHHVILCEPDFAFVQDGTRQDAAFRQQQHEWYVAELTRRNIPYLVVNGSISERVARIVESLGKERWCPR